MKRLPDTDRLACCHNCETLSWDFRDGDWFWLTQIHPGGQEGTLSFCSLECQTAYLAWMKTIRHAVHNGIVVP